MADRLNNFIDPRAMYSGGLTNDFIFRGASSLFSNVQFIPERITQFSITPEGIRYYKVAWQESWLPEHQLLQHQSLIETYWRTQNDLAANESSTQTQNQDKPTSLSGKSNVGFLSQLNISDLSSTQNSIATSSSTNVAGDQSTIIQQKKNVDGSKEIIEDQVSKEQAVATQAILAQVISEKEGEIGEQGEGDDDETPKTYIEIPLNVVLEATIETENANIETDDKIVELKAHQSTWRRKPNTTTLQLEGFDLVNVENSHASAEELAAQARETLNSFRRKRVRFPNGTSKLPQECFFCLKMLSNRKKLREHQFSVHFKNVGEFICGICKQRFVFGRQLKAHMLVHSDNRNFQCNICGLTCKRRSHLHKHMDTHSKEKNYRCDVCHKNFKVQAELKTHCFEEHKNQIGKCNVCKQTLHTPFSVYIHSMRHSGTRDHLCETCGATFKRKQHLIAHMNIHTETKMKHKCPECDKEFPDKKYIRKHIEQFHKELASTYRYDYICNICDKDFAYKGRLDEHMKSHENETEEERSLRARKKRVDSLSDEAINQISDHAVKYIDPKTQEVRLRCKLCRKREFRMISSFEKHVQDHKAGRIRNSTDSLECEECCRSFISLKRLERHKLTHQLKKTDMHECLRCEQTFAAKSILQAHARKCTGDGDWKENNKGAEKRKATLKAKELMLRHARNILDDNEDYEDDEDDSFEDIDGNEANKGEHVQQDGEEAMDVSQVEQSNEMDEEEPMVAMQQDTGKDIEEEEARALKFNEQEQITSEIHEEAALVALQVIEANQGKSANIQLMTDPSSNVALSYVMDCVNQVVANEQVLPPSGDVDNGTIITSEKETESEVIEPAEEKLPPSNLSTTG